MKLSFSFQGEEVYSFDLPNGTTKVEFHIPEPAEVFKDTPLAIPVIKCIQTVDTPDPRLVCADNLRELMSRLTG